jgi:CheY-like chemotaxis protein
MSPSSRILLVDDNDQLRQGLRKVLEGLGYLVSEANDWLETVQLTRNWVPDVALIGLGMHVVDGFGVARRVRAALGDAVRLVAVGSPNQCGRALAEGFDSCLLEPADAGEVLRHVEGAA